MAYNAIHVQIDINPLWSVAASQHRVCIAINAWMFLNALQNRYRLPIRYIQMDHPTHMAPFQYWYQTFMSTSSNMHYCTFTGLSAKKIDVVILTYYYPFKKYVEYIFSPGCLSMMSRSILRFWLAARTIASFVFVGDCLKQFKTINTNNHKLEWLRHSFSTFLLWSSLVKYQL